MSILDDIEKISHNLNQISLSNNIDTEKSESKMPEVNFALLKAFADTIPVYDGRTDLLEFFINAADQFHSLYSSNDIILSRYILQLIKSKLTGRAQILIGARLELNSWQDVKTSLRLNFGDPRDFGCLGAEMAAMRPFSKESFSNFGKRIQDIRSQICFKLNSEINLTSQDKIVRLQMYDESAFKTFIKHLTERLRDRVLNRSANSLEDALRIVREDENLRHELGLLDATQRQTVPHIKQNFNHIATNHKANHHSNNMQQFKQANTNVQYLPQRPPSKFPADYQNQQKPFFQNKTNTKQSFPNNQQVFGKPQNVWKPNNTVPSQTPTPMSITSRATTSQGHNQSMPFRQTNYFQPRNFRNEELHIHEYNEYPNESCTSENNFNCEYEQEYFNENNETYQTNNEQPQNFQNNTLHIEET